MSLCTYIYVRVCVFSVSMCVCVISCICKYVSIHICMDNMSVCAWYIYDHMLNIYIYIYIYIYVYVYIVSMSVCTEIYL
jgi:hypothetical protein